MKYGNIFGTRPLMFQVLVISTKFDYFRKIESKCWQGMNSPLVLFHSPPPPPPKKNAGGENSTDFITIYQYFTLALKWVLRVILSIHLCKLNINLYSVAMVFVMYKRAEEGGEKKELSTSIFSQQSMAWSCPKKNCSIAWKSIFPADLSWTSQSSQCEITWQHLMYDEGEPETFACAAFTPSHKAFPQEPCWDFVCVK